MYRLLRHRVLIGACYGALSLIFCAPVFSVPNGLGFQDWDVHLFFYGAVLKNLVEYGQLPFWNPWYCGGNVLWQNPQVALLSPVYPLAAIVSLPLAMKVNIVLHYWIGFIGMHLLLARVAGLRFLPGLVFLASVFVLSGAPAMHLAMGHGNFLPAFYLPLQLFLFCRALQGGKVRDAVLAAALLALMVFNGGLHIVPMAVGAIGTLAVVAAIARRDWRPIAMASVFGAAGLALAGPKLIPILFYVTSGQLFDARTVTGHPDLMSVEMLLRTYLDPYQNRGLRFDGQIHGWYEYGNYIGLPAVLLLAASVAWIVRERRAANSWLGLSVAVTTLLMLALSAGEFGSWAPASIAAHVPLLSSFRIPSRYTIAAVLFAVFTIAWAVRGADGALDSRARVIVAVMCAAAIFDLGARNGAQLRGVFSQPPIDAHFRLLGGPSTIATDRTSDPYRPGSPMFRALMSDQSFYRCYEVMQLVHTADADRPLVSVEEPARIFATTFSPNRVEVNVVAGRDPARVRLNQNFAAGWRSDAGPVVADPETGQPSVELSPGRAGRFSFVFRPPGLLAGIAIMLLALGLSVWCRNSQLHVPATLASGARSSGDRAPAS